MGEMEHRWSGRNEIDGAGIEWEGWGRGGQREWEGWEREGAVGEGGGTASSCKHGYLKTLRKLFTLKACFSSCRH